MSMKASVNYWMVGGFEGEVPVIEAAERAKSMGYDAIELCFGAGELTPETSPEDLAAIKAGIDGVGIEISSLATGNYWSQSLSSPDVAEQASCIAFTESYIRAAGALGIDAVLIMAGNVDVGWDPARPVVPAKQAYELSRQSIRSLLPVAEQAQVCIAIENVWSKFLTGPFEYLAFIESFASPFVKAYFDVGNCLINGYPEHWIELLGGQIARVHFKNFSRRDAGGTLSDFTGSLLEGDVNWPNVFAALKAAGYDRFVTAEVIVSDKGMPDLEQAGKVAKEMRGLIEQYG
jgi:L-ribulose-5-phosphate 3-epimerase